MDLQLKFISNNVYELIIESSDFSFINHIGGLIYGWVFN